MKFGFFNHYRTTAPQSFVHPELDAIATPKPRRERLTARWVIVDGKLTCKWEVS